MCEVLPEDTEPSKRTQLGGDLGAKPTVGEPHVDNGEVGPVAPAQCDRFGDGAGDAAHFVTVLDKYFFGHIGDHQLVFRNQDLHNLAPLPLGRSSALVCTFITR